MTTTDELNAARWTALNKLADATVAYRSLHAAGFAPTGPDEALERFLEDREAEYVKAHQQWVAAI